MVSGYQFPTNFCNLWQYLHEAYSNVAFTGSCPSDEEIMINWLDHIKGSEALVLKQKFLKENKKSQYSFYVPMHARPAILVD